MCGIVGYLGKNNALPILVDGLRRLEYRGYDSAGVALQSENNAIVFKSVGKIKNLEEKIGQDNIDSCLGIAHTRWATHGAPTEINAHPHVSCDNRFFVVHNGIIENYQQLKELLSSKGHKFKSETDTEVIAHLFEEYFLDNLFATAKIVLKMLKGAYGLVVFDNKEKGRLVATKLCSPLVIGVGNNETIIASDVSAIVSYTNQVIYLNDGEIADIDLNGVKIFNNNKEIKKDIEEIERDIEKAEKGGFPHFMIKEIFEQAETIKDSFRGRLIEESGKAKLGGLDSIKEKLKNIDKLVIVACGTARCAGLVGEYMLEEYAGIPTEVDYASEFRYRKPILDNKTAVIAISQSGETADTLAAIDEAKEKGVLTLGVVNTVGSTIARKTDAGVYNHVGPEISVASTKAFTSQVLILSLLTLFLGRQRQMSLSVGQRIVKEINLLPSKIEKILTLNEEIKTIAQKFSGYKNFAFLGRKYNNPVAFEGAIKLKELSYIHAEGFPAGEMKHGPIAMIDENFPCIFIVPKDSVYEKNISNMEEIKARGGKIIAIATEGDEEIKKIAEEVIYIPKTLEMLTPVLAIIPLQLLAYHMATIKGLDVDKPRNLAKSVTVE